MNKKGQISANMKLIPSELNINMKEKTITTLQQPLHTRTKYKNYTTAKQDKKRSANIGTIDFL